MFLLSLHLYFTLSLSIFQSLSVFRSILSLSICPSFSLSILTVDFYLSFCLVTSLSLFQFLILSHSLYFFHCLLSSFCLSVHSLSLSLCISIFYSLPFSLSLFLIFNLSLPLSLTSHSLSFVSNQFHSIFIHFFLLLILFMNVIPNQLTFEYIDVFKLILYYLLSKLLRLLGRTSVCANGTYIQMLLISLELHIK